MLLRITLKNGKKYTIQQALDVVVVDQEGNPCVLAQESTGGSIVTSNASEREFSTLIREMGLKPPEIEIIK